MTEKLLMGNEAFAHAALEAGVSVVAGYPGTPSSELIETIARLRAQGQARDIYVEWSTNEKAALEVAFAASLSGARSLFTCKQVGLNVASDALMSANYVGTVAGLVIFVADDPGPISSQTEQDTRRFASFAKVPVLDPATPEQGFKMMKSAFELSEKYHTPVIVRPTTRINHASTFIDVADETHARPLENGGFNRDPAKYVIFPKRSFAAHAEINERLELIARDFSNDSELAQYNMIGSGENAYQQSVSNARNAATLNAKDATLNARRPQADNPTIGIMASGVSVQYAKEALALIAKEASATGLSIPEYKFMQIGTPFPFPRDAAKRFLEGLSDVLVLEELDHVIEDSLLQVCGGNIGCNVRIHGKLTKEAIARGENSTEACAFEIAALFDELDELEDGLRIEGTKKRARYVDTNQEIGKSETFTELVQASIGHDALINYRNPLPARPPVLCAGCPHRASFYAVKAALRKLGIDRSDAIFCGDIGCYTLGNTAPLDAVDTCLCMGGGITMAQGIAVTDPTKRALAFIGDSTFFASGMTGIANAVYNNHDMTICILDNSTTAMTGMQPHPGTGQTLMGTKSDPIEIANVLTGLGVKDIFFADPLDKEDAANTVARAIDIKAPTAVIFKSPCIWLKAFDSAKSVATDKCTGCKKCISEIGCPAIWFDECAKGEKSKDRGQASIDADLCNGCGLCVQICPFSAIGETKDEGGLR